MKKWHQFTYDEIFFTAFLIILVINIFAVNIKDGVIMHFIDIISLPVFLIFFFARPNKINTPFIFFFTFLFLGENVSWLFQDFSVVSSQSMFYCFAFLQLIVLVLPKFEFLKLEGFIKAYLIMMVLLSLFFIKVLHDLVGVHFLNEAETLSFYGKSLVLIVLVFVAYGYYLCIQSKLSILFLIAAVCFGFCGVVAYINFSYPESYSLITLKRTLFIIGVYFIFKYIIEENNNKQSVEAYSKAPIFTDKLAA